MYQRIEITKTTYKVDQQKLECLNPLGGVFEWLMSLTSAVIFNPPISESILQPQFVTWLEAVDLIPFFFPTPE